MEMNRLSWICLLVMGVAASAEAQQQAGQQPEIPAEYRPPKGMCRIWLKDVPPAQQPAPTDCAAAVKNCPPTGRVVFGETAESKTHPKSDPKELPAAKALSGKGNAPAIIRKPPF
jgi:hypothetical protein